MNFPGIPQCEKYDFFMLRIILATSKGEVFRTFIVATPSFLIKFGAGSSGFGTVDLDEKYLLKILLCCNGSWIVQSFSTKGGIVENLLFFINFSKIPNFFLADIEGFLIVLLTAM